MQSWRHPFCGPPPCMRSGIHVLGVDSSPAAVNASGTQKRTASEGSSCRADSGIAFTLRPASLPFGVVGVHRIAPHLLSLIAQLASGPPLQAFLRFLARASTRPVGSIRSTLNTFGPGFLLFHVLVIPTFTPFGPRFLLLPFVLHPATPRTPQPTGIRLERRQRSRTVSPPRLDILLCIDVFVSSGCWLV